MIHVIDSERNKIYVWPWCLRFFLIYGLRWINWVYTFAQITFFFQTEKGVEKVIDKDTKE